MAPKKNRASVKKIRSNAFIDNQAEDEDGSEGSNVNDG